MMPADHATSNVRQELLLPLVFIAKEYSSSQEGSVWVRDRRSHDDTHFLAWQPASSVPDSVVARRPLSFSVWNCGIFGEWDGRS